MAHYQPRAEELPLVVCPDGVVKKNPSVVDIGRCLGMLPSSIPTRCGT
jgi:thioredoxin reductase (NADPH)